MSVSNEKKILRSEPASLVKVTDVDLNSGMVLGGNDSVGGRAVSNANIRNETQDEKRKKKKQKNKHTTCGGCKGRR
jgi:hypothetical protein